MITCRVLVLSVFGYGLCMDGRSPKPVNLSFFMLLFWKKLVTGTNYFKTTGYFLSMKTSWRTCWKCKQNTCVVCIRYAYYILCSIILWILLLSLADVVSDFWSRLSSSLTKTPDYDLLFLAIVIVSERLPGQASSIAGLTTPLPSLDSFIPLKPGGFFPLKCKINGKHKFFMCLIN